MKKEKKVYTIEIAKKIYDEHGLELLEEEYINYDKKMKARIKGTNYLTTVCLGNILMGQKWYICHKSNPYSMDNIKTYLKENNIDLEVLEDEYVSNLTKFKVKCSCGEIYDTCWASIRNKKKYCCNKCTRKRINEKMKLDKEFVYEQYKKQGYIVEDINEYQNNSTPMKVINKEGYKGKMSYGNLFKNNGFDRFSIFFNEENLLYNANLFCKLNKFDCEVLDYIKNEDNKVKFKMKCSCGEIYYVNMFDLVSKKQHLCYKCSSKMSKYERYTEDYLKQNNIEYICQYRIDDCKNKRTLPFDFYLPDYNILIEVDGEYHYEVRSYTKTTNNKRTALDRFEETKRNDNIKNEYCKNNNIKLIRIPFWYFKDDKYERVLSQEIR